jgi:biotin carboxyl carrier protein
MKIYAESHEHLFEFDLTDNGDETIIKFNGDAQSFSFHSLGQNRYSLIHDKKSHLVHILKENGLYHVHIDGYYFPFRVEDERMRALRELVKKSAQSSGEQIIKAPIPGLITRIKVTEGQSVNAGDGLLILEAMKMENEIKADFSSVITKIHVEQNQPVEKDQDLLTIVSQ